jgi:hypothetical protein
MIMKRKLFEGFKDNTPDLRYYAFDWDDNIVYMPTKIMVKNDKGQEMGMSTEDFAKYRSLIGVDDFNYEGERIVGYAENPFKHFRTEGDKRFIIDAMLAEPGPSWGDFVECINNGSIFSIITARGHTPSVIKEAVYNYIVSNITYPLVSGVNIGDGVTTSFVAALIDVSGADSTVDNEAIEVYIGGTLQLGGYTVTNETPVTVLFDTAPAAGSEVTILVRRGVTWYAPGINTPSNGVALQDTNTVAARFLRGE